MPSPFPPTSSKPGHGHVHLTLLPPATPSFGTLTYTYPLKLLPSTPHILKPLSPSLEAPTSQSIDITDGNTQLPKKASSTKITRPSNVPLVFLLTYGGGLLAGDTINLHIVLDAGTRLAITTQGSTKVYRPPDPANDAPHPQPPLTHPTTRQDLLVKIRTGSALWLAPDPVQPFAGSFYAQSQTFEVEKGGSLGMVDWVSEGRTSRGEKWGFDSWRGRNEVWSVSNSGGCTGGDEEKEEKKAKRRLLVRDAVILEGGGLRGRMDGMGVFGTMLLRGPLFEFLGGFFVEEFGAMPRIGGRDWGCGGGDDDGGEKLVERETWRKERVGREKEEGVLWTACHIRGVCVVKFSGREVGGARWWLGNMLRREGTVLEEFGEGGLMFVR